MATKYVELSGQCYWAKLKQPDTKYQEKWTLKLYPTKASWDTFKSSGMGKQPKEDALGKYINLDRKTVAVFKGKPEPQSPPDVIYQGDKFEDAIGNGSSVTCTVEVYDTNYGVKGSRLRKVVITDLVPYERPQDVEVDLS